MRTLLVLLLPLVACDPADVNLGKDSSSPGGDSDPNTLPGDSDTTPGGDSSGGDSPGGDSDTTDWPPVSAVSWRLHDSLETLVYVSWEQAEAATVWVEYSFDAGEWLSTPPVEAGVGPQEHLLLGIPYGTELSFRVVSDAGSGAQMTGEYLAETAEFPNGLPYPNLIVADPTKYESSGNYLLASINEDPVGWGGGDYWLFIIDREGRVVWAQLTDDNHWTIYSRVSYDGDDILWDEATYWSDWDGGSDSVVHRMKIDGSIVQTYETPGLHHAFTELADETIVWGAAEGWSSETLEELQPDGTRRTIWDCEDWQDETGERGECQSNTLFWNEKDDTFLYSFYTNNTAIEVDHATGEILRQWGEARGSWAFDPPESQFYWQHGLNYLENGHLLLSTAVYNDGPNNDETAAREYEVDDETQTLHEVWNFGLGEGIYAETAGEAHRLANGNTLHNYGSGGRIREVTSDGEVVWDVEWGDGRLLGRTVLLEDLYAFAP